MSRLIIIVFLFLLNITARPNYFFEERAGKLFSLAGNGQKPWFCVTDTFFIGIYYGPTLAYTNEKQYQIIKEANVDIIQNNVDPFSGLYSTKSNLRMLSLAQKAGLKILVCDPRVLGSDKEIKEMVAEYKDHPALAGYDVKDEPYAKEFDKCAAIYKTILSVDPNKMVNVSLHPMYARIPNYERDYVEAWVQKVGPQNLKYLSFDYYPYSADGSFRDSFYINLDIIRRVGLKYGVKTSAYLQSIGVIPVDIKATGHRRPNEKEMRHNVYTMLAYGIKHPIWFTYWSPHFYGPQWDTFTSAIIDSLGNKTDLYSPFQKLNGEMRQLGKTLIDLDAREVYHTGDVNITGIKIPEGLSRLPADFTLRPEDISAELVITDFVHQKNKGRYVMITNKSYSEQKTLSFFLDKNISSIKRVSEATGETEMVQINKARHSITQTFLPGQGKLFLIGF